MDKFIQNNIQITNINNNIVFCAKCISKLDVNSKNVVKDSQGRIFCCKDCRKDYYAEIRKENDALYDWWVGRDNGE